MVSYFEQKQKWRRINSFNKLKRRAVKMIKVPTEAEALLWGTIQKEVNCVLPEGYYFQRQYVLSPFILDFYCRKAGVCIEVDGVIHEGSVADDAYRDSFLKRNFGVVTFRVKNEDVYNFNFRVAFMKKTTNYIFNLIKAE